MRFFTGVLIGLVLLLLTTYCATWRTATEYVIISVYNPVPEQTDADPLITADGSKIDPENIPMWVAVSRDLLKKYPYGSKIQIHCNCPHDGEIREVHDTMNARFVQRIDLLTSTRRGFYAGAIRPVR